MPADRSSALRSFLIVACAALLAVSAAGLGSRPAFAEGNADAPARLLLVRIDGPLDNAFVTRLRERITRRLDDEPGFAAVALLFSANAVSGDLGPSQQFAAYLFDEVRNRALTIAWLPRAERPLGATIGPIMACQEIALGRDAVLSALADDPADDPVPRFDESFETQLTRHARHFLRPTLLGEALVDRDHDAIFRVVLRGESERRTLWDDDGRRLDFLTRRDFEALDDRVRNFDVVGTPDVICPAKRALKVPQEKLEEWRIGRYPAAESPPELLIGLLDVNGIAVDTEHVIDLEGGSLARSSSAAQGLIDFLNQPVVRIVLILGGCLGLLLELKAPGTFLPGLAGLFSFLVLFVSSLFPVSNALEGTASIFEVVLFFIGIGLIAVEFFLLPGVAVFALAGGGLALFSLIVAMVPPHVTPGVPQHLTPQEAIGVLVTGFGVGALGFAFLLRYLPRSRWGRGGIVNDATISGVPDADSTIAAQLRAAGLLGKRGRSITPLRPAGKVVLDEGTEIDVVAESGYVDRGEVVEVTKASSMRIEVRHVRPPSASPEAAS